MNKTLTDLIARKNRLNELALGLMKEAHIWRKGDDPLLRAERQEYLQALYVATSGIESARVALVRAIQRIQEAEAEKNWPATY